MTRTQPRTIGVLLVVFALVGLDLFAVRRYYRTPLPPDGAFVAGLRTEATRLRGLSFTAPAPIRVRVGDDFTGPAARDLAKDPMAGEQALERALGLIPPAQGLLEAKISLVSSSYGAYYDPAERAISVRSVTRGPRSAATLVHEMTHALQHQHFAFDRVEVTSRDAQLALDGLLEGDAERIEMGYLDSRGLVARAVTGDLVGALFGAPEGMATVLKITGTHKVPAAENQQFFFPYLVGPAFVRTLLATGGQRGLDGAFRDPPTTTEHLLHPDRYLAREMAKAVTEPVPDSAEVGRGVVGELRLVLLLSTQMPRSEAEEAAAGWGGDRYVSWEHAGRSCARVNFVMDTQRDARELLGALNRLVTTRVGVAPDWDGTTTTFTACR